MVFGVLDPYCKSIVGLIHGLGSVIALGSGLSLYYYFITGLPFPPTLRSVCIWTNLISTTILMTCFWNKFQAFTLTKTALKDHEYHVDRKGSFYLNRGRGIGTLNCSVLMLLFDYPEYQLWIRIYLIFSTLYVMYILCKWWHWAPFFQNGFQSLVFCLATLFTDISYIKTIYPHFVMLLERSHFLYLTLNTWGYLWYYLFSRGLVAKDTVRHVCFWFHVPSMSFMPLFISFHCVYTYPESMTYGFYGFPCLFWVLHTLFHFGPMIPKRLRKDPPQFLSALSKKA